MKPPWIKIRLNTGGSFSKTSGVLNELRLATVCEEAHCPNLWECWSTKAATFMVLGKICTRACRFCAVSSGLYGEALDASYPTRLAEAVTQLDLEYVSLTSVCRDDLGDSGAAHLAECVAMIKKRHSETIVEVLAPDFQGDTDDLAKVLEASPDVLAHNIETVRRLQPEVRDRRADYYRSLSILEQAKEMAPRVYTKSSLMLGLGESENEVLSAMHDLRTVGVDLLTLGQYLQPTKRHLEVHSYIHPSQFKYLKEKGERMGFADVTAGPLVRSTYHAAESFTKISNLKKI